MLDHLPWMIAGLVVGLFLGYGFGKYKGASELSSELDAEDEPGATGSAKAARSSPETDAASMQTVFVRRGGSHYHKETCRHLRRRGGEPMTKAEARKKHYRQCPSCRA